jgi:hypothetical protein
MFFRDWIRDLGGEAATLELLADAIAETDMRAAKYLRAAALQVRQAILLLRAIGDAERP